MKKTLPALPLFLFVLALLNSCSKAGPSGNSGGGITYSCSGISPKFSTDVQPILNTVCSINSNCHGSGSSNTGGPFTNHAEVSAKSSKIKASILSGAMPQSGSLSQAQVNAFLCWIDNGSQNN